jgi:uncharacterized Fe-S cluster-containing MiaB family protein
MPVALSDVRSLEEHANGNCATRRDPAQIDYAFKNIAAREDNRPPSQLKLYNSGSFFDRAPFQSRITARSLSASGHSNE